MPNSDIFIYIFTFPNFEYFGKIKLGEENSEKIISAIRTIFDKEYFALIITKTKNLEDIFGNYENSNNDVMYG